MFVIGICDDEQQIAQYLKSMVDDIMEKYHRVCEIHLFASGTELLEKIEDMDVVFLDIEMPEMDGIQTGLRINAVNPKCKIIMATAMETRYKDAFRISALRFVTKPFKKTEVQEALNAFLETRIGEDSIGVYMNRQQVDIRQKDILYIRSVDSYSEIVTRGSLFRTERPLIELMDELDDRLFYRIHKKYIVNMAAVKIIEKDNAIIDNEKLKISRRNKVQFEEKYLKYRIKYR